MEVKENLDLVLAYTKQFIDAVTPVAKQAYEIGLLTLRIDAAHSILLNVAGVIAVIFILRLIWTDWNKAKAKAALPENANNMWKNSADDHMIGMGIPHVAISIIAFVIGFISTLGLLNVWMWTKLFAPELWLAHQAVEKLLK